MTSQVVHLIARARVFECLPDVLIFEIRIRTPKLFAGTVSRNGKNDALDRDPHPANARLPIHLRRLDSDSIKLALHNASLPCKSPTAQPE